MSEDNSSPTIDFPCDYPIKVMGANVDNFREEILIIIRKHAPDLLERNISFRESRNGNYLAVNVMINATGTRQIQAMFEELKASGRVSIVL